RVFPTKTESPAPFCSRPPSSCPGWCNSAKPPATPPPAGDAERVRSARVYQAWTTERRGNQQGTNCLLGDPERVGLVEPDIATGVPCVIRFLRHVTHTGANHDRLADAVHCAD